MDYALRPYLCPGRNGLTSIGWWGWLTLILHKGCPDEWVEAEYHPFFQTFSATICLGVNAWNETTLWHKLQLMQILGVIRDYIEEQVPAVAVGSLTVPYDIVLMLQEQYYTTGGQAVEIAMEAINTTDEHLLQTYLEHAVGILDDTYKE